MTMLRHLALAALLVLGAVGVSAQDFDKGAAALQSGDFRTALEILLPLAERGDEWSQALVALMYYNGDGVVQDYATAAEWNRLAAIKGVSSAQYMFGLSLMNGTGVSQDYGEAAEWFHQAAKQGNSFAQNNLGVLYENGNGVLQDHLKAHMWYNLSSANGNDQAKSNRNSIAAKMTPEDISKAQAMASECMNSGYKNCGW